MQEALKAQSSRAPGLLTPSASSATLPANSRPVETVVLPPQPTSQQAAVRTASFQSVAMQPQLQQHGAMAPTVGSMGQQHAEPPQQLAPQQAASKAMAGAAPQPLGTVLEQHSAPAQGSAASSALVGAKAAAADAIKQQQTSLPGLAADVHRDDAIPAHYGGGKEGPASNSASRGSSGEVTELAAAEGSEDNADMGPQLAPSPTAEAATMSIAKSASLLFSKLKALGRTRAQSAKQADGTRAAAGPPTSSSSKARTGVTARVSIRSPPKPQQCQQQQQQQAVQRSPKAGLARSYSAPAQRYGTAKGPVRSNKPATGKAVSPARAPAPAPVGAGEAEELQVQQRSISSKTVRFAQPGGESPGRLTPRSKAVGHDDRLIKAVHVGSGSGSSPGYGSPSSRVCRLILPRVGKPSSSSETSIEGQHTRSLNYAYVSPRVDTGIRRKGYAKAASSPGAVAQTLSAGRPSPPNSPLAGGVQRSAKSWSAASPLSTTHAPGHEHMTPALSMYTLTLPRVHQAAKASTGSGQPGSRHE